MNIFINASNTFSEHLNSERTNDGQKRHLKCLSVPFPMGGHIFYISVTILLSK